MQGTAYKDRDAAEAVPASQAPQTSQDQTTRAGGKIPRHQPGPAHKAASQVNRMEKKMGLF